MRNFAAVFFLIASLPLCAGLSYFGEVNVAYDDFRGIPDGTWNGNTGALIGANFGASLFDLFGVQAGGSYGVYDWQGRGPVAEHDSNGVQQQGFLTAGIFRRAPCLSGVQGALAFDLMLNKNFGVFALNPSIGQFRFQGGYLFRGCNEFGFWGTYAVHTSHRPVYQIEDTFRAISQINLFWRHIFTNCAEAIVWGGLPYEKSLMFPHQRAGRYIVGGAVRAPLTERLNVEAHGVYMGPSGNREKRFHNYDANICIGLSYSFGSRGAKMARPYLPVANNSNFLVDTSLSI